MDAKDVRIFCEMAFGTTSFSEVPDRHVGPSEIGRRVGLDEKTVRIRVKKMEEDGFIKYYQVMPNLNLFGLGLVGSYKLYSETLSTKYNLLSKLQEVPNLVEFIDYMGQFVSVAVAGSNPGEIKRSIDELAHEFMLGARETHRRQTPMCKLKPDNLDWQIVKELRYSARRSPTDLAKALRITPRMAEYRIGRLLDSGAMLVRATIDPTRQTGLTFYELELTVDIQHQDAVAAELETRFGERLWSTLASKGVLFASLFGFSLGEAEDGAIDAGK
ncbi:MAG TPA: winged helix-turn-helix transcriptional regulator, partial [Nitrososphaerales archaeon]|nr:winged helix-turn-helix transcriptional regulator [Nitrososphaerales archaeon]